MKKGTFSWDSRYRRQNSYPTEYRSGRQLPASYFFVKIKMLLRRSFIPGGSHPGIQCDSWRSFSGPSPPIPSFYTGGNWGLKGLSYLLAVLNGKSGAHVWFPNQRSFRSTFPLLINRCLHWNQKEQKHFLWTPTPQASAVLSITI